ncbi:MAG: PAS domain S-box protein, partial [Acidobacteriaceae bacterium]|nr:PAS domain S-box protein [Acidobacteriaceae bacterium]
MDIREFRRILLLTFLLPIAALLIVSGVLSWQIRSANLAVNQLQLIDRNLQRLGQAQKLILDQETGLRGYQLTHDEQFLDLYRGHEGEIVQRLNDVEQTPGLSLPQTTRIRSLRASYLQWKHGFADLQIEAVRTAKDGNPVEVNLRGKAQMDIIRSQFSETMQATTVLRQQSVEVWQERARITRVYLLVLSLLTGTLIAIYMNHQLNRVSLSFQTSVTSLQERADQLFASEQRLRTTLVSIGDGVIVTDGHGLVTMLNPIATELTGWTIDEAFGQPIEDVFDIVNEETRLPIESPIARVKRMDRVMGLANHTILRRRDGTEVHIDDSGAPIRDAEGLMMGVVIVFRDITHEKQTQRILISNERLAVTGRLAATIAHEIHNPLDSVANILYLLRTDSYEEEERRHLLEMADQELSRVTQISRAMLSLYRESRTPVPVELRELLQDLISLISYKIQRAQVTLEQILPETALVEGYPAELRQVFTNLITNAYEAADPGGFVRVELIRLADGARVILTNSGAAIDNQTQQSLFQPFFSTKGERGTGLGLWVSRGILSKHGGRIELESPAFPDGTGVKVTVT